MKKKSSNVGSSRFSSLRTKTLAALTIGIDLHQKGKLDEAEIIYQSILKTEPRHFDALHLLGVLATQRNQYGKAIDQITAAVAINAQNARAYYNLGFAYQESKQFEFAILNYEKAIYLDPNYYVAHSNKAATLKELNRLEDALDSYNTAIELSPTLADAHSNCAVVLQELNRLPEAVQRCNLAIDLNPNLALGYYNRGIVLNDLKDFENASNDFKAAIEIKPDYVFVFGLMLHTRMKVCNWRDYDQNVNELFSQIMSGQKATSCFPVIGLTDSLQLQHQAALTYTAHMFPPDGSLGEFAHRDRSGKIKLGYYSADLHNHATAYLMAELFERHDKTKFELFAFSFGPDTQDEMRARLLLAFDHFIDVRQQSDKSVAQLSRELGIDIAVDLKGYTTGARPRIFSYRVAPIQVSYLGYPGTLGASYIDYLIADPTLIPPQSQAYYSEKIAYLPNSYQVNDRKRVISARRFSKQELGLPEEGFVFCCFNNNFKITPSMLDTWVRILKAVECSVLWLFEDNAAAGRNLREQAVIRGLDPSRLVFAPRMNLPDHLARHAAADLFLDTLPCNAHTTASDALWAGLPVLTCTGEAFASRVAASLLNAIELPELVTTNIKDYEDLAIELAQNSAKLKQLKEKLARNRLTTPLFNTDLFASNIEALFSLMTEQHLAY
jgi:predicted O-linked N-acetylglucosamine transferase (SPINDLY family)